MRVRVFLGALLVAATALGQQVITPAGKSALNAQAVQGVTGGVPMAVSGSLSVSGTADIAGNTATFNANNVCSVVLTAGEQSVGFHLTAGTLDATLTAYGTNATVAVNCATAGTCTAIKFSTGSTTLVVTNPNGVQDLGLSVNGGMRQVEVCTTTYSSGSATGVVTATFLQAASSGGGGGGSVTQGSSPWVTSDNHTTAAAPIATRLSDGSGFYTAPTSTQLPTALDGSGFLKTHEQGTAAISAASLPLPTNAATESGHLAAIDTSTARIPAQGQALAAASLPVVLTAIQQAALTPPAAITGFALEAGHLAAIDTSTGKIPSQGQALAGASMPVVLPAAQITTLTPPAAITGYALDATLTGGTAKAITRAGAKGATSAADVTSTAEGTDHQALDVQLWLSGSALDPRTRSWTLGASDVPDLSDRAARLLGVVYGSQAQQLKQTATNFNLQVELATGGTLYDARSIRALTSSDVVTVQQGTGTNLHMVCDSGCSSSAGFADLGAFTTGTTSINPIGGLFDDTPPTAVTTGKAAAARITANRALHTNLRNASGTEIGTSTTPLVDDVSDRSGRLLGHTVTDSGSTTAVTQATASNLNAQVQGPAASGAAKSGNPVQVGGVFNTTQPTVTTGQAVEAQSTARGALIVATGTDTFNATVSGTVTTTPPSNASTNVAQLAGTTTDTNSGVKSAGTLRVVIATDQPALTNKLLVTPDSVALPANQSVNVSQVNGVTPLMGNGATGTGSPRVTIASDNTAFSVNAVESGTWTVQPGNTQNTTPWLASINDGTNTAKVLAASTAPAAADKALVVAQSPQASTMCSGVIAISQTTSTDLKTSTAKLHICGIVLVSPDAESVSLVEGTGSTCGTGTAAVIGATTAANGIALVANTGFSAVAGTPWLKTQTTADHLCLLQSSTGRIAGVITYQDAP